MSRRIFWRWLLFGSISLAAPALAQDGKLIDAAKKEGGKVIIYSSMESSISDGIAAGFKKKTGLEFVPMDRLDSKTYAEKKKEYQKLFLQ